MNTKQKLFLALMTLGVAQIDTNPTEYGEQTEGHPKEMLDILNSMQDKGYITFISQEDFENYEMEDLNIQITEKGSEILHNLAEQLNLDLSE